MSTGSVINELHAGGNAAAATDLSRGQFLSDAVGSAVRGLPAVGRGAANVANAVAAPFGVVGKPVLRGLGHLGSAVAKRPGLQKLLFAASLGIPTLGSAALSATNKNVQDQLNASNNPGRTVLAHHLIKSAAAGDLSRFSGHSFMDKMPGAVADGIGKGLGTGLIDNLFSLGAVLGGSVLDSTVTAPKRQKVFYEAIKTDVVLRDSLRSNPAVLTQMKEAFATMVRFAPSLSLDINAVRSYLREAVISGGGINYATIKQLADTEKVIHDRNTPRK